MILAESHSIPKFHGQLIFLSGNAAAADRAPGLAEMTATVVRTGTQRRASRQLEEDLRSIGADLSTEAGSDISAITFTGLSEFAEPLLDLVHELAREASFPEGEFERERRQKLEEVKLNRTQPSSLAGERLRKVLFGAHPYSQVSPSEAQVAAYKREDLQSVYREFYTPQNALLLLVGDFEPQEMLKDIKKVFGSWSGNKPPAKTYAEPANPRGRRVYLVHMPGAVQTQILAGCHAITRKHPDWIKLGLTNTLYGGAFNSRLVMNIREDKGYTYSPRSSVNALRQRGYFSVSAAVRNEVVAASLTELFAPDLMSRRIKAFEQHYPWIASEGLDYFRSRVTQGRNDATEGLALLPASPRTPEVTERLVGAVEFKCDILWSILDAIAAASGDAGSRSAGHHG